MNCPDCGTVSPAGAKFCFECGSKLVAICPQCGVVLLPQARFCFECGARLGAAPPMAPQVLADRLQQMVPKEFVERLLSTRGQVGRERRMVTILFSDVKGSTAMAERLDPEDWLEIMDGAFDVLIEPIYRHEGTVARLMGDAILAFFGAPIAHEDDPERAIRAALEISAGAQRYAEELARERGIEGFNVRVGIHTGLVVVGEVGSDLRVEYTAMGDAVNLAARLEQNAPQGGTLITRDTYRHVRGVFAVEPQELLAVKGKAEPVQTYLVLRAKPRAFRKPMRGVEGIETRMIGREAELKHLQEAFFTAMEDGALQVVTVVGEAGVGKSRLLYEFDLWSELLPQQFFYFRGRASHEMGNLPYSLIRDLIAFRLQIQDTDPPALVRDKLDGGVGAALGAGEDGHAGAHSIGHLAGFRFGESAHLAGVRDNTQGFRDRALTYLADYLQAMAAQLPVLILLEDLHWADDSSLDTLNHLTLALSAEPVMIVCTARPALFERRPHWGEGQGFHRRLELDPLSRWDSRRLVAEILQKAAEVPRALRDRVVAGAEGNPFFIEELIKMLVEDGIIVTGEDRWRLESSRLSEVRVPPTLTGVLQARLDRLPPKERTILQQASVVGRLFWDRAVMRISGSAGEATGAEVTSSLSLLRGREMVFQRETSAFAGAREYLFKHSMLREVTYESVLKRQRRTYHGLVAGWLMERGGERADEHAGLIADHLELAGRMEEAVEYLIQAGDRARGLYAHPEAIDAYQRALRLLDEQGEYERRARLLTKLGLTYQTAFKFQQARQAYDEGFALWQRASEALAQPAAGLPPAPHALRLPFLSISTLDHTTTMDVLTDEISCQLFSALFEQKRDLDIVPDIARNWEVLDGGRTYVFHLREDVRWSDGTPVTASDFEYTCKRMLDPAICSFGGRRLQDIRAARAFHQSEDSDPACVGVHARGPWTLVVELEGPTPHFLHVLAMLRPVPRHAAEALGAGWADPGNIVTNGPFRLESWQRDESMVLVRNPAYHGRCMGNVERVELCFPEDLSNAVELYETGRLDALNLLDWHDDSQEMERLLRRRYVDEYVPAPTPGTDLITFDVYRPPFDDSRVRRAIVLATDRETLAEVILAGVYAPATGGLVPPGMPGHSPDIALPYAPERARQLLAEAGYPDGRGFPAVEALCSDNRGEECEFLLAQWRQHLGIDISWRMMESSDFLAYLDAPEEELPNMAMWARFAGYRDPAVLLPFHNPKGGPIWCNQTYEALLVEAGQVMEQGERMKLYQQADRLLIEQAVIMPFHYTRAVWLVKPWVQRSAIWGDRVTWKDVIIEPH